MGPSITSRMAIKTYKKRTINKSKGLLVIQGAPAIANNTTLQ